MKENNIRLSKGLSKRRAEKTGKVQFDITGKIVNPLRLDISSITKAKLINDKDRQ